MFGTSPYGFSPYGSTIPSVIPPYSTPDVGIVNRVPYLGDTVFIYDPICFGARSNLPQPISLSKIQTGLGYAQCVYKGIKLPEFTQKLRQAPYKVSLEGFDDLYGNPYLAETISRNINSLLDDEPLELIRPIHGSQNLRSTYYLSDEVLSGQAMTTELEFEVNSYTTSAATYFNNPNYTGAIIGSIYGPGQTALFAFLTDNGLAKRIVICDPSDYAGVRSITYANALYEWSVANRIKLKFVWLPVIDRVKVYVNYPGSGEDMLYAEFVISDLNKLHPFVIIGDNRYEEPVQRGSLLFGLDGHSFGDQITIYKASVHSLFAQGIIDGNIQSYHSGKVSPAQMSYLIPDSYLSFKHYWQVPGERCFEYRHLGEIVPNDSVEYLNNTVILNRTDLKKINVYFREEPEMQKVTDSWYLEGSISGVVDSYSGVTATGMGIRVALEDKLIDLQLLNGAQRTLGILKKYGNPLAEIGYEKPLVSLDWSSTVDFKLVVNGAKNKLELFSNSSTPILTMSLSDLPSAVKLPRGVYVGWHHLSNVKGRFNIRHLAYGLNTRNYDGNSLPTVDSIVWNELGTGVSSIIADGLEIVDPNYKTGTPDYLHYKRLETFAVPTGITVDFKVKAVTWKSPQGIVDDLGAVPIGISISDTGARYLMLIFVNGSEKRVGFIEGSFDAGVDNIRTETVRGREVSTILNWAEFHEYRIDWNPVGKIKLFIDDFKIPVLELDAVTFNYPTSGWVGGPGVIFGSLHEDYSTTSIWRYVRYQVAKGFDIELRRKIREIEEDFIYGSEGQVVAEAATV